MAFVFGIATFLLTLAGGLFALRFQDKLHLILGFSAGAVLGVSLLDLLPEAIELGLPHYVISDIALVIVIGFVAFMVLDRLLVLHAHDHEGESMSAHGAAALSLHSFLDGFGIGLGFKVSAPVGVLVAVAVLVHDFSDGINTVNFIKKNRGADRRALRWLLTDATAPMVGIIAAYFVMMSSAQLGILLALFSGFFLYIGASDLLPESHHRHPTFGTTLMTILGILVMYVAVHLAG